MIDLLLNAVKIALSDDTRKNVSALLEFIRKSPDWQRDICSLEAQIDAAFSEHAYLLGGLTADKMRNLGFSVESVTAFEYVYRELSSNAFHHACRPGSKDRVAIIIEVTSHYVSVTVKNPRGRQFDLAKVLKLKRATLRNDQRAPRGRGLLISEEFADSLAATSDGEGVKAVFYKPAVVLRLNKVRDLAIIHVIDGLENPSLRRRIKSLTEQCLESDIILDLAKFATAPERTTPSSTLISGSLEIREIFETGGRKMVSLVNRRTNARIFSLGIIDPSILAFSVDEALEKVGKPDLKSSVEMLIAEQNKPS